LTDPNRIKLLHGPYRAPPLKRGDRAWCLLRDCVVVVTSWTDARIPWPRCRALDGTGGSRLLLDEELARAVRCESAAAVRHWWRVSVGAVWRWRKALGVTRTNNDGSRRLIHAAADLGAAAMRERGLTDEECDERSRTARRLNLAQYLRTGYHGPRWTKAQLRLLGKYPDDVVAARVGRTVDAVRCKRTRLGIPTALDRRKGQGRRGERSTARDGKGPGRRRSGSGAATRGGCSAASRRAGTARAAGRR
jgi:hypothetical protein